MLDLNLLTATVVILRKDRTMMMPMKRMMMIMISLNGPELSEKDLTEQELEKINIEGWARLVVEKNLLEIMDRTETRQPVEIEICKIIENLEV